MIFNKHAHIDRVKLKLEIGEGLYESLMSYAKGLLRMRGIEGEIKGIEVIAEVEKSGS